MDSFSDTISTRHLPFNGAPRWKGGVPIGRMHCTDGVAPDHNMIMVSGAKHQSTLNGMYNERAFETLNGHPCYVNSQHDHRRVMYWTPDDKGHWVIAEATGFKFRAVEPDGSTPQPGPGLQSPTLR